VLFRSVQTPLLALAMLRGYIMVSYFGGFSTDVTSLSATSVAGEAHLKAC